MSRFGVDLGLRGIRDHLSSMLALTCSLLGPENRTVCDPWLARDHILAMQNSTNQAKRDLEVIHAAVLQYMKSDTGIWFKKVTLTRFSVKGIPQAEYLNVFSHAQNDENGRFYKKEIRL